MVSGSIIFLRKNVTIIIKTSLLKKVVPKHSGIITSFVFTEIV